MRGLKNFFLLMTLTLFVVFVFPAAAQDEPAESVLVSELDPAHLVDWTEMLYRRIEAESVSAPGGARIYGYAAVTQYEALLGGMPINITLAGQIHHLPDLPYWDEEAVYDWLSVLDGAMGTVLPELFFNPSEENAQNFESLLDMHTEARVEAVGEELVEFSQAYGRELGDAILAWVAADGFLDTRQMTAEYVLPEGDGLYVLTGEFPRPLEPFWGQLRPFYLDAAYECAEWMNYSFSTDPESTFYKQAEEVMNTGNDLTEWQQETARYWVDTPGVTGTPAGHWWSIGTQLIDQFDLTLDSASMMYAMLGPTLADSFISCWYLKYETLIPRPETFIQENIRRRWTPYIQSPPFPEYPSGHSVVSAAAAEVLIGLYGTRSFVDETHIIYEHEPLIRAYTSFEAAATEAAISRLYGGIHYRAAIESGVRQGRCIGQAINGRIRLSPVLQGGE